MAPVILGRAVNTDLHSNNSFVVDVAQQVCFLVYSSLLGLVSVLLRRCLVLGLSDVSVSSGRTCLTSFLVSLIHHC